MWGGKERVNRQGPERGRGNVERGSGQRAARDNGTLSVTSSFPRSLSYPPSHLQSPSDVRAEADLHHLDEAYLFSCKAVASLLLLPFPPLPVPPQMHDQKRICTT